MPSALIVQLQRTPYLKEAPLATRLRLSLNNQPAAISRLVALHRGLHSCMARFEEPRTICIEKNKLCNGRKKRRRKPRLTGLSKQRQRANARERLRMRDISAALLQLRYHLPASFAPKDKKLSKIQTLRFAIRYIGDLWEVLRQNERTTEVREFEHEVKIAEGRELIEEGNGMERTGPSMKLKQEPSCLYFNRDTREGFA